MQSDNELLKRIEGLEKQVKELVAQKKDSSSLFGRTYSQVGSSDSDFLIKTRGQVKIQWGKKFIDLLKDGKINVNSEFIFKAKEVGSKDGIYVLENGTVWIKMSGVEPIPVVSNEVGTTYVSFLGDQAADSAAKHQAMVNIGFLYPDMTSFNSTGLRSGIVYIESEKKLYVVNDGILQEFKVSIPNPFTEQFIIAKGDSTKGALLIQGTGVENSLTFDKVWIYSNGTCLVNESEVPFLFRISKRDILEIAQSKITANLPIEGNTIQSRNASSTSGFRMFMLNGKSILEVDQLTVRDQEESADPIYPEYWLLCNNVIIGYSVPSSESQDDETEETNISEFALQLSTVSKFEVGDKLIVYRKEQLQTADEGTEQEQIRYIQTKLTVTEISNTGITVECEENLSTDDLDSLVGKFIFLIERNDEKPIRIKENTIDIIKYPDEKIDLRIGPVKSLQLEVTNGTTSSKAQEVIEEGDFYSKQSVFGMAKYLSSTVIPDDDDSSTLASTEWVRRLAFGSIPKGVIVAYNGSTDPPEGWAICDGNNGTPNLIDKFIMAGSSNQDKLVDVGIPIEGSKISLESYSLIFIMKL